MVEGAGILPDLPARFQDSNGDGIGDIPGMIARLDYLKWLGVGAVWLCPVYDSPNADMGYDIRDYEKIMSEFGTMEDFDTLLREMHKRDINTLPFNPLEDEAQMRQLEKDKSGVQFSHTAHEQLTGQLKAGLQLLDLYEDTNGYGNLHEHNIPTYWATLARKA